MNLFRFGRRKKLQLSVIIPKELGEANFAKMIPTLDDYEPASLPGWIEWERKGVWQRLLAIGSWLPGGEHHRFETLLGQLGLNEANIKALRGFVRDYFSNEELVKQVRPELESQIKLRKQEIETLKAELKQKQDERVAAEKVVLLAKVHFVEVAQAAAARSQEIEKVLASRQISLDSYRRQLDLLPQSTQRRKRTQTSRRTPIQINTGEQEGEKRPTEATA